MLDADVISAPFCFPLLSGNSVCLTDRLFDSVDAPEEADTHCSVGGNHLCPD